MLNELYLGTLEQRRQSRRGSEKSPSWRRSVAILTVSAIADVAYLSAVARRTGEMLLAWSVLLFVLSLGACIVATSTAYPLKGAEVALFASLIWLVTIVFAPHADL